MRKPFSRKKFRLAMAEHYYGLTLTASMLPVSLEQRNRIELILRTRWNFWMNRAYNR